MTQSEAEAVIRQQLTPGEELVWSGVPDQRLMFLRPNDRLWLSIGITVLALALLMLASTVALDGLAPAEEGRMLALFVGVGLYATVGRLAVETGLRRGTAYGLTDRRVVFVRWRWWPAAVSLPLADLETQLVHTRPNGSGSLLFGTPVGYCLIMPLRYWRWPAWPRYSPAFGTALEGIADVERVHSLILDQKQKHLRSLGTPSRHYVDRAPQGGPDEPSGP